MSLKDKVKKVVSNRGSQYKATALIMGKKFTGKGETIYEALGNIDTGGIAGKVILTVERDGNSKDRVMPMAMARRTFKTLGLTREVALKNTANLFEGI